VLAQLGRFLLVGLGNTVLSFVCYLGLVAAGLPPVAAAPAAFGVGAVNGYIWNRRWTFKARDSVRARTVYVVVQAAGALATSLLVGLLDGPAGLGHVAAYLVTVPPVTGATFVANRVWTFPAEDVAGRML